MAMDLQANPVNELLYTSFNQDFTCFACGTESGFKVFSTDPFRLTRSRDFAPGGGIGVVAMLFRTNILAFAGGGRSPRYQPHKVVIWDDLQARTIAELSFRSAVRAVRLRRDLVVVVLSNKVYVYGFRSLSLLDSIETTSNPKGLCCLSIGADRAVLVCPGMQQGRALVIFYPRAFGELQAPVARERTTIIAAHESPIAAMATDYNGMLLATASDKGTILRVYDTMSGTRRQELRRGADRAEIHSLAFSPTGDFLVVSSDKGTIHIFAVGRPPSSVPSGSAGGGGYPDGGAGGSNAKSSLQRISRVLPAYFSSEWSLAQFRVPDYRCIAAFGADPHTVVAICANGSYYKARFDPTRGGEMVREEYAQFDDASSDSGGAPSAAATGAGAGAGQPTQLAGAAAAAGEEATPPLAEDEKPLAVGAAAAGAAAAASEAETAASASAAAAETAGGGGGGGGGGEAASPLQGAATRDPAHVPGFGWLALREAPGDEERQEDEEPEEESAVASAEAPLPRAPAAAAADADDDDQPAASAPASAAAALDAPPSEEEEAEFVQASPAAATAAAAAATEEPPTTASGSDGGGGAEEEPSEGRAGQEA